MLVAAMRLMHSPDQDNPGAHQHALAQLLSFACSVSDAHRDAITRAVGEFKASNPAEYAASALQSVGV